MMLYNLKKHVEESKELLKKVGVKPGYIVLGKEVYRHVKEEIKKSKPHNEKFVGEVDKFIGLDIIVDNIQKNVVYILDKDTGAKLFKEYKFLKLAQIFPDEEDWNINTYLIRFPYEICNISKDKVIEHLMQEIVKLKEVILNDLMWTFDYNEGRKIELGDNVMINHIEAKREVEEIIKKRFGF